jgi:3D (Asp-Asp-Asp) domain-containing protein
LKLRIVFPWIGNALDKEWIKIVKEDMRYLHTTYLITTVFFVIIAAFLLIEKPLQMKQEQAVQIQTVEQKEKTTDKKEVRKSSQPNSRDVMAHFPKVEVVATGYYAGVESTGKDPSDPQYGITYSGVKVKRDPLGYSTIAADLHVFPLGTVLYIPGYGYGVVADIGSAIKGKKIDLYYDSIHDVYKQWGKKKVNVYIVKRGNGVLTETMLNELSNKEVASAVQE